MSDPFFSQSWYRVAALRPRIRSHGQVHRHSYRGQTWYVLQDHASGRSHRFTPAAYAVIGAMDGQRTVQEIWELAGRQLGEDAPTQDEVIGLLSQLHTADLLQSDAVPDTLELFERAGRLSRGTLKANLRNPLAIRFPLWNPDRFLERTLPWLGPLFGWFGGLLWLAVVVPAALLALEHWSELTENFTDRVLAIGNLAMLWLVFPVVKLVHELGHGYATKAEGGEVHELGVMLLALTPVPYVDSSAASVLRSKWRRALIGAAGMICELFLAALALHLWLVVEPGVLRALAFNVVLVAGVSTLVFNLNPLLRYDGYYILTDLIEMPNLSQRSGRYWAYLANRYLFGEREAEPPARAPGERRWLLFYGPVAFVYRVFVVLSIALFVASTYAVVGIALGLWGVVATIVMPLRRAVAFLVTSPRLSRRRGRAVLVSVIGVLAAMGLLFTIPAPLRTQTEGVVWLPDNALVRAGASGFVQRLLAEPGAWVKAGDPLVESRDLDIDAHLRVLEARLQELEVEHSRFLFEDRAKAEIVRQEREATAAALGRALERSDSLVARAGADGRFVVPRPEDMPGRFARQGEVLGYVTDGRHRIVRAIVYQDDIELVRDRLEGVEVRLAGRVLHAVPVRVLRDVPAALDEIPSRVLSAEGGGMLPADPRDPHGAKSLQRLFQLDLELPAGLPDVMLGTRAHVRFDHAMEPIGMQLYRRVRQLFLSRLNV
jgi:putative peptide zinc metalloprotease protein